MSDRSSLGSGKPERSRWPPLTRMLKSGEMNEEGSRRLPLGARIRLWMVYRGYQILYGHGLTPLWSVNGTRFLAAFAIVQAATFAYGFLNYYLKSNFAGARSTFGVTYPIARASALVLHFDVALILLPVCRTLVSLARQTPLNGVIQLDKNIRFHKCKLPLKRGGLQKRAYVVTVVAWSIVFFTWVHTIAHWNNFAQLSAKNNQGIKGFLMANFATGPGLSGYIMLTILMTMAFTSLEKPRRANFERFWNIHHLFIVFFLSWSMHGAFCMIKPDVAPFCAGTGLFWQYWVYGGVVYLIERILREVRGKHKTFISKVIQHPSNIVEIQIKKEHTKSRAGQYVLLCCPEVSIWQYHPFTLTSAPEEDYLSVHIRCVGDFTRVLSKTLGCNFEASGEKDGSAGSAVVGIGRSAIRADVDPRIRRIMPRIYIDGPFGSASEDVFKYEVAVLVGAGIGVTPFASILKSIWYRMNYPHQKTRLRKVYFFWVCRDFGSFEWFRSLLMAIEIQDMDNHIEILTYLTAKIEADDATNIMINNADADHDTITGLRTPTNFGRPNWDAVFKSIRKLHDPTDVGVFYCGPELLASQLQSKCNLHSRPGFKFVWKKENF